MEYFCKNLPAQIARDGFDFDTAYVFANARDVGSTALNGHFCAAMDGVILCRNDLGKVGFMVPFSADSGFSGDYGRVEGDRRGAPPARASESPAGFEAGPNHSLLIITPIFDDWTSARHLLIALERIACDWGMDAVDIVAVDDGSSQSSEFDPNVTDLTNIRQVTIVRLACNVGHQRAIAVGLSYAFRLNQHEYCLVIEFPMARIGRMTY